MKNILFIAPPAAGKGTYSKLIEEKYHIPHISTGDLLREVVTKDSPLGRELKTIMATGKLISDDIITKLLKERLSKSDCNNGYILDGYPRNINQAKSYEQLLQELNKELGIVIYLEVDKEIALNRVLGRVICSHCGASFNTIIEEFKPSEDGICDLCHHPLEKRVDDNKETFLKRFNEYIDKTSDLIQYYNTIGVLKTIHSKNDDTTDIMFDRIRKLVEND